VTFTQNIKQIVNNIDIFSPYIIVVFVLIYVALAALGYYYHIRNLNWPDSITYYYIGGEDI